MAKIALHRTLITLFTPLIFVLVGQQFSPSQRCEVKVIYSGEKKATRNCTLVDDPVPVVLIALGRSGSSSTWDAISALTSRRNIAYEYTGSNPDESRAFFEKLASMRRKKYDWVCRRLEYLQNQETQKGGIVGFQWKPFGESWKHEFAVSGLKYASQHNPIRVIYLTRNPLDRRLSNMRHDISEKQNQTIPAHCAIGDSDCVTQHALSVKNRALKLPAGGALLSWLRSDSRTHRSVLSRLREFNVSHVHVTYEKLYNSDNAEEWMRIFRLLERGPTTGLTMDEVRNAFAFAPTTSKKREDSISNVNQVRQSLKGTQFQAIL